MERVAFLIEKTNQRLSCLLNPESLTLRRVAGVRQKSSATGRLTGAGLSDDPLLFTGGGRTELLLDLLFDVTLAGSSLTTQDVRELTHPLWNLAENAEIREGYGRAPVVRFVWGKWNISGIIVSVAERLEYFTPEGVPRRSWLRMRFIRTNEPTMPELGIEQPEEELQRIQEDLQVAFESYGGNVCFHEVIGGSETDEAGSGERLDEIAYRFYGNPRLWRLLAFSNDIEDPLRISSGSLLRIPLMPRIEGSK